MARGLAAAIGLQQGEEVQWILIDRETLQMQRCISMKKTNSTKKKKRNRCQNVGLGLGFFSGIDIDNKI